MVLAGESNQRVNMSERQKTPTAASLERFTGETQLKAVIVDHYQKQIVNYFGDERKAMAFLSAVVAATQRLPALLQCTPQSVINSFMTMAQLGFMPSGVSGEAYVLPYDINKKVGDKWVKVKEAQFQLGYQGLVTLFYRAGVKQIAAEIVYEHDSFEFVNGQIRHTPDVFSPDRGKPKGAYVIVTLAGGGQINKVMAAHEILAIGKQFSKSFDAKFSPWNVESDPQLWMWKKTVLKQCAKLVPKNETIAQAIAEDNKDSIIADRFDAAKKESEGLSMGSLMKHGNDNEPPQSTEEGADGVDAPEGPEAEIQIGERRAA